MFSDPIIILRKKQFLGQYYKVVFLKVGDTAPLWALE